MPACHLCAFEEIVVLPAYEALHRVTSDCKPWPAGGQLAVCPRCGGAQAIISRQWEVEAAEIYNRYTIYHQSGGAEQGVFDAATGAANLRSTRLLHQLREKLPFLSKGRMLDVGCGNGTTLRSFHEILPGWSLAGLDVTDRYRQVVQSIPGVEALYNGPIIAVPGQFQIITLIHSLEHIAEPAKFLTGLCGKLVDDGILVIQVPDCWQNPFMFLVADHATHFFASTLHRVAVTGGYEVIVTADNWIAKELTLIARKADQELAPPGKPNAIDNVAAVRNRVEWVATLGRETRALAAKSALGLFGTSIAATWLQEALQGKAAFFVDEDPNRFGQMFMERQVLHPTEVPRGTQVMIALPTPMAIQVRARLLLNAPDVKWLVPPALP